MDIKLGRRHACVLIGLAVPNIGIGSQVSVAFLEKLPRWTLQVQQSLFVQLTRHVNIKINMKKEL